MFEIVRRSEIPEVNTVVVEGKEHWLGVLKDFRKEERLRRFLPPDSGTSIAWVRLEPDEVLEAHTHPVSSLILVVRGTGLAFGDLQAEIGEGDAVLVPPGARHGFVGKGSGFWGVSIQFEPRGLYEDETDPWVTFVDPDRPEEEPKHVLEALLTGNAKEAERFAAHPVFVLAKAGRLDEPERRRKFLDCLQVWSTAFQRMMTARMALSEHPAYYELARRHLEEELGHDRALAESRPDRREVFDPVLDGLCSWFCWKMHNLDDVGRVVLVHLVVEGAANVFYRQMRPFFMSTGAAAHFDQHQAVDEEHLAMAVKLLRQARMENGNALLDVQRKGWAMMRALMSRLGALSMGK